MDRFRDAFPFPRAAPIAILGVPFDNVSTAETIELIERMIASRRPHYLATANVDFLVQAAGDAELRRILFDADLVLCDGTPLLWASRLLGNPLRERVAGSDLIPLLLRIAAEKGYRPFFLGASPGSIEAAVARIRQLHPTLRLAGYFSPPYSGLLEMDHDAIRERITRARPDLLFVGFGCPKQEKWINMHYRSLGVPVSVGIGGTIDFLAGKLARAPRWMRKCGMEWVFRVLQEPRRLGGRYARDIRHFSLAILAQYWRLRLRKGRRSKVAAAPAETRAARWEMVSLPARLDCEEVHQRKESLESSIRFERPVVLDARGVEFIDSTGVGWLIRLQKRARFGGQQLWLLDPSESVRRALRLMRLEEFFVRVPDLAAVETYSRQGGPSTGARLKTIPGSPLLALAWSGEVTAANVDEVWMATMDHLAARSMARGSLVIDLSELEFIDSAGLGLMVRAKKHGARQGLRIHFHGVRPNVLNVIRLSRLEEYLLASE